MLDIKYIREHKEEIIKNSKDRGAKVDIERLLQLDTEKNTLRQEYDRLRETKNKFKGKPTAEELKELAASKEKEDSLSEKINALDAELREIWFTVPNLTHPDVHISGDEDDNPVMETVGKIPKFNFPAKDHVELSEINDLVDFERATKITGSKFYYLKNELALLEFALIQYALETTVRRGFTPFSTPDLAKKEVLLGLGFNPRGESTQVYNIEGTDLSLIGTAEIAMGGYHMNETFKAADLPKKYVAVSHCFRTEAGSYSKFSKGIFRVHQFTKIEMFQYVLPQNAETAHLELLEIEKEIFTGLEIPFRVVDHCTADLGAPAIRTYDLEAWMPGKPNKQGGLGDWGEITSTSNCTDYQSRALNIKYEAENGKKDFVYMLNGTAIAISRALIAIIENNQNNDGSINVPKILQKYIGKKIIKRGE